MAAFRTVSEFFAALASYRDDRRWGLSRRESSARLVAAWRELPAAVAPPLQTAVWRALVSLRHASRLVPDSSDAHPAIDGAIRRLTVDVADAIDDAARASVEAPEASHEAATIPPPPAVPRDTLLPPARSDDDWAPEAAK